MQGVVRIPSAPDKLTETVGLTVYWYLEYKDCCPDIGMGPFVESATRSIMEWLDLTPKDVDVSWIVNAVKTTRSR